MSGLLHGEAAFLLHRPPEHRALSEYAHPSVRLAVGEKIYCRKLVLLG